MIRAKHILVSLVLGGGIALGASQFSPRGRGGRNTGTRTDGAAVKTQLRQERSRNGNYAATIVGSYRGDGTADVTDAEVSIHATLVDNSGKSGKFSAEHLAADGPYFSGIGTLFNEEVVVRGRLDAARSSRLTAMFFTAKGGSGRIVAKLPTDQDPGDNTWIDDDFGRPPEAYKAVTGRNVRGLRDARDRTSRDQ